jgi:hypothetical protein
MLTRDKHSSLVGLGRPFKHSVIITNKAGAAQSEAPFRLSNRE